LIPLSLSAIFSPPDASVLWSLFWHFAVISLLAFGGGQAVLPWIERDSVGTERWTTAGTFTAGVGFGYLMPGPVTVMSTFIGYQAGRVPGALAATLGMFLVPVVLAALSASGMDHLKTNRHVRAFGQGAAPAVVGLLGATLWSIAKHTLRVSPLMLVLAIAIPASIIAARTKIMPIWILIGGAVIGWLTSFFHL
jgi:chromate transporter